MRRLFLAVILMLVSMSLYAHLAEYSPFAPKTGPKLFPVQRLVDWRSEDGTPFGTLFLVESNRSRGSKNPMIRITWAKQIGGIDLSVLTSDRRRLTGPVRVSSSTVSPYGYSADLNGDDTIDYILIISYAANGAIGGGVADVVFVLSAGDQYKVSMVKGLYPDENDFWDVSGNGQAHFLDTSVVGGFQQVRGKDGRIHNYWLYNLLAVEGSTLKLNNSAVPGFPKLTLWTFRRNHDETDQFTAEEKLRLFNPEQVCIVSTPDRPCPGYFPDR